MFNLFFHFGFRLREFFDVKSNHKENYVLKCIFPVIKQMNSYFSCISKDFIRYCPLSQKVK